MSDLELKEILTKYPDCLNNGTKLKAILLDEYPNVQKAIINTLSVIVNLGIAAEMQHSKTVTVLEYNRWKQVILDEGYSENIIDTCLTLFINSIKLSGSVPPNTDGFDNQDFIIKNYTLVKYCGSKSYVEIPNGIKVIGKNAFEKSKVISVVIPDSVLIIDEKAFFGCDNLKNVSMSNSITEIKEDAFSCCPELNSFMIPDSIRTIGDYAFYGCLKFTEIIIPKQILAIGIRTFYECFNLKLIKYHGTMSQLQNIVKYFVIDDDENFVFTTNIKCFDGIIPAKVLPYL